MFKDINKAMLLKLVALHVIVIIVSNALVAVPVEIMGVKLTWAAFTFPLVVIATDLTVRLLGKSIARQTIAVAYPLAIIGSVAVVLAEGAPGSVALRIGFASATGGWHQRYQPLRRISSTRMPSLLLHSTTVQTSTWRQTG